MSRGSLKSRLRDQDVLHIARTRGLIRTPPSPKPCKSILEPSPRYPERWRLFSDATLELPEKRNDLAERSSRRGVAERIDDSSTDGVAVARIAVCDEREADEPVEAEAVSTRARLDESGVKRVPRVPRP